MLPEALQIGFHPISGSAPFLAEADESLLSAGGAVPTSVGFKRGLIRL